MLVYYKLWAIIWFLFMLDIIVSSHTEQKYSWKLLKRHKNFKSLLNQINFIFIFQISLIYWLNSLSLVDIIFLVRNPSIFQRSINLFILYFGKSLFCLDFEQQNWFFLLFLLLHFKERRKKKSHFDDFVFFFFSQSIKVFFFMARLSEVGELR